MENKMFKYELGLKEIPLEEALNTGLPKWPQCIIYGEQVSREVAFEVIRRTDAFFTLGYDGNDREFIRAARRAVRMPLEKDYYDPYDVDKDHLHDGYENHRNAMIAWRKKWGCVPLEYLHNSWISSSWIGGPNGWMHKDGEISYMNNIGKWPEAKEVWEELCMIAGEFPTLRFFCTLCNAEEDEESDGDFVAKSILSFKVWDGEVTAIEPIPRNIASEEAHKRHGKTCMERLEAGMNPLVSNREGVFAISELEKWEKQVFVEPPVAAAQETKYWRIPVTWEMYGTVAVEASSPEEALEKFREIEDGPDGGFALPEGCYVDGSFDVDMSAGKENLLATIEIISE